MRDAPSMPPLAIVPARGGSKGLPAKNLAKVANRSLVAHACAAAYDSRCGPIVVSTDDSAIEAEALRCGALVVRRPSAMAADTAQLEPALLHAAAAWGAAADQWIVVLQPTSPLRPAGIIDQCIDAAEAAGVSSAYTVHVEHGLLAGGYEPADRPRRQDVPGGLTIENGSVYVVRAHVLYAGRPRITPDAVTVCVDAAHGVQVDDEADLARVRALWSTYGG